MLQIYTMRRVLALIYKNPFWLILLTAVLKIPMFFTNHIQEDSFITWRVAKNLVRYGVIGFNGNERISASTTHVYVLISAAFYTLFGDNFIYPLLIFSSLLFAVGSWWLAKILFPDTLKEQGLFVILLNLTPPALTASVLGMEYGILFFLYSGLLYFGLYQRIKWAFFIFPVLLLWTRIDTAVFLSIFFLADLFYQRKINAYIIIGGIVGITSVVGFNYLYFGEIINHTITAKKIAYKNLLQNNSLEFNILQWAYYGGLIKKYSYLTLFIFLGFLSVVGFVLVKIIRHKHIEQIVKVVLLSTVIFAIFKISLFAFFKAYFDWYYWLPRVFLFAVVLYYFLKTQIIKSFIKIAGLVVVFGGLYLFQWIQSYTVGYMEERQRMQIAADINADQAGLDKSILLEPAGIIPFFTGLYTYDEVGLVNERINDEMLRDEKYWWINSVIKYQPDYILTIAAKPQVESGFYSLRKEDNLSFSHNYELVKTYQISRIHDHAPALLKRIYRLRPLGKDYFLYRKKVCK